MKLLKKWWFWLALVAGLSVLYLLAERWHGQWRLARWKADYAQRGGTLDIAALRPALPPAASNAFPLVLDLARQVRGRSRAFEMSPPLNKFAAPGKMIEPLSHRAWPRPNAPRKETISWPELEKEVDMAREFLPELREALERPEFVNNLDYETGAWLHTPHLMDFRELARYLNSLALVELKHGRHAGAAAVLELELRMAGAMGREPLLFSQLVAQALAHMAFAVTWQGWQDGGWTEPELARVQRAWQELQPLPCWQAALSMEMAMASRTFDLCRRSSNRLRSLAGGGAAAPTTTGNAWQDVMTQIADQLDDSAEVGVPVWLWGPVWSFEDEWWFMRSSDRERQRLEAGRLLAGTNAPAGDALPPRRLILSNNLRWGSSSSERLARALTLRELAVTALALRRYALRHGHVPRELSELTPEFMPTATRDWMGSGALHYRAESDRDFILYSVGLDGRDDGGDSNPEKPGGTFQIFLGRDVIWPKAATVAEIQASEEKSRR